MNAPLRWQDITRDGGFTTTEVSRLLDRTPREIASWLRGNPPLIASDYEPVNGRPILSFEALVEARAISHFLDEGVKASKLRSILAQLRKSNNERHPLARSKDFVTDGFRLFEKDGDQLVNLANEVYASPELMKPALRGHVIFEHGRAAFFQPDPVKAPNIRIDPHHAFGKPVIFFEGRAVTVSALADAVEDEGLAPAAEWFGVTPDVAAQALAYERRQAA